MKGRTAANTAEVIFYDIVCIKGVPLLFHSDAAQEFLATAMTGLQSILGIQRTDTLAHNPKSNAKIERVWEFVGRALRTMSREQYANFHMYVPILAHVWNTTPDSDTNITPFEAEHGMKCRSVEESILQTPPRQGRPATAEDLKTIALAAKAYNEVLSNIKAVEKANTANKLNSYGKPIKEFKVGDKVGFYLPPTSKQAERMGKNPKHMLHYKGPGYLKSPISNTTWNIQCDGRIYRRNIMHIVPYTSDTRVAAELTATIDDTVTIGSYVAVLDDDEDKKYHIAQVRY